MKLLTYKIEQKARLGVLSKDEEWVFPLRSMGIEYEDMMDLVRGISDSEKQLIDYMLEKHADSPYGILGAARLEEVTIEAPIIHPGPSRL